MNDMTLIEVEIVSNGRRVTLPATAAERLAKLGTVRLPEPRPDLRYQTQAKPLPLASTWVNGQFVPVKSIVH
jgi:hypothetical protein